MKILILGAKSYSTRRLLFELKAAGLKAYIADPSKFVLSISDKIGHDKIYYNGKRIFRNTIDFVVPRIGGDFVMGCKVLQHLSNNLHIPTLSTSEGLNGVRWSVEGTDWSLCDRWVVVMVMMGNRLDRTQETMTSKYFNVCYREE